MLQASSQHRSPEVIAQMKRSRCSAPDLPECQSFIAHPPLRMRERKKKSIFTYCCLYCCVIFSFFDLILATARYYRQQLLFNICCKQEVSGGMQSPSPFLESSEALLWATSMLLFIGRKVGCPAKPQSKWQREIIWRPSGRASCCLQPVSSS